MKTLNVIVIVFALAVGTSCNESSQPPESNVDQDNYPETDTDANADGQISKKKTDSTTFDKPEQRPLTNRLKPKLSIYQG